MHTSADAPDDRAPSSGYRNQAERALELFAQLRNLTPDDAREVLARESAELLEHDFARLRDALRRTDPPRSPATASQYVSSLRRLARDLGNPLPHVLGRPPGSPTIRRPEPPDPWRWVDGVRYACPNLTVAARLAGMEPAALIAAGLQALAAQHRGGPRVAILTAAREFARLGDT